MMAGPQEEMIIERNILDAFESTVRTRLTEDSILEFLNAYDEVVKTLERK